MHRINFHQLPDTVRGTAQVLDIIDDTENGIVRVVCVGELESTDYGVSILPLENIIKTRQPIRLLLDWTRFSGWSEESESRSFWFRIRHRGAMERIAIIGERKWRSAATELDTIVDAEVRLYDTRHEDEAVRWLRDG